MQRCDQRGYCVFDHYKATYDIRGNKTAMTDADLGSWSFSYDGLSELTSQTDAKSQSTTFTHDLLDRPVRRTEADLTSLWTYDGAGGAGNYGVGKPFRDCNAGTCAAANYERTYAINSLGQTTSMQLKIDGTTTYTYAMTYESGSGRLSTLTYPSGFVAKYDYNAYGYLSDIKDNATGAAIWTANTRDAELHLTEATSGPSTKPLVGHAAFDAYTGRVDNIRASNDGVDDGSVANLSYDWDSVGNLTERDDTIQGTTEKFCYDSQNRLNNYAMGASCSATGHIATIFSPAGNVQRRTDICNTSGCMTYGSGAGPHALTAITGTVNGIVNPAFTYDANGNMTAGMGRSYSWTSYNMASQITQGTTVLGFTYNTDHQRLKQCIGGCTSPTTTVLYLNNPITGAGSEKSTSGSTVVWHDYIVADGGIVAERTNMIGVISMQYFVLDHLGSTAALTDTAGNTLEQDYYDPWGKRRNATGSADPTCSIASTTTRGFSGHEMLDSVCLTNMNARLYDQQLGRFLSADSIAPAIGDGQNLNRYSYVDNRPTSFTDPTGNYLSCEQEVSCHIIRVSGSGDGSSNGGGSGSLGPKLCSYGIDDGSTGTFSYYTIACGGSFPISADAPSGGSEGGASSDGKDDQNKKTCDPDTVGFLNGVYKFGGGMQEAAELGMLSARLFAMIPGAQPEAAALAAASVVVGGLGIAIQGASGWELSQQTGDSGPFRNSLIGGVQSVVELDEPVSALANGISGDVLGHHSAHC